MPKKIEAGSLKDFIQRYGHPELGKLAVKAGSSKKTLEHYASGFRNPSIRALRHLIEKSNFRLSLRGMLSDRFPKNRIDDYWQGAPPPPAGNGSSRPNEDEQVARH